MDVLIHSKTSVEHEIEIIVPPEELAPHFEKAYREEAKNITLPGFRKGRVPVQLIRKRFGEAIEYQVIEKLSNEFFKQAVEERNIKPIGQPSLHDLDYKPGLPLTIKISYQTAPDVVATDYLNIPLERLTHVVTDEEVEDEVNYLRQLHRTLESADHADEEGFLVTCDIQILSNDGEPLPNQYRSNVKFDLGDETLNRDLKAELLNMHVGEEKDIELMHETKDGEEDFERAHIKVNKIERIILPELDDEFAKLASQGKVETMDALRTDLRSRLEESWQKRYQSQLENDLINEIIRRNPIDVPEFIVEEVLEDFVNQLAYRFPNKKLPDDFNVDEFKAGRRAEAVAVAKWIFIRDSIIEKEGIKLEDSDVETVADERSAQLGISKEQMIDFYKNSAQMTNSILIDKLMKYLLDHASIREVSDDDLSGTAIAPLHTHDHNDHFHDEEPTEKAATSAVDSSNDSTEKKENEV